LIDDTDLEEKTIEALRQYRKALTAVENLEQEEASAHRALTSMLPDLGRAILEDDAPSSRIASLKLAQQQSRDRTKRGRP
jgi:hypothetical protein